MVKNYKMEKYDDLEAESKGAATTYEQSIKETTIQNKLNTSKTNFFDKQFD